MTHANYHEVEAASHDELGQKLGRLFGDIARADIAEAEQQKDWKRKLSASRPLLAQTRHYFPQYVEELEAYARAAGIPILDLWTLSIEDELDLVPREKCTTVVTNDGKLISHNEDWDEDADESVCVLKKTVAGVTIFEIYYYAAPLGGNSISINSHGTLQAINSLPLTDGQVGVSKNVIARWLSETRDIESDFNRLKGIPRASGYNHVFVTHRGVFDIECTATEQVLFRPSMPFVHTNHLLSPALARSDGAVGADGTFKRHAAACRLSKPAMSTRDLTALTDDTSGGRAGSISNQNTIGKAVIDLAAGIAKVWLRREKRAGWVDYRLDFFPASAS